MSRTELHKGILRKVERNGLTLEELCEKICKELNIDYYEGYTWYRLLKEECSDYVAHNGELYYIEDEEFEEGTYSSIIKNEDGTYSYVEEFWNGGTDLVECLERSLNSLDNEYELEGDPIEVEPIKR